MENIPNFNIFLFMSDFMDTLFCNIYIVKYSGYNFSTILKEG